MVALWINTLIKTEREEVVPVILAKNMRDKHEILIPGSDPPNFQAIKIYERKFFMEPAMSPTPPTCSSLSHDQVMLRLSPIDDCEEQLEQLASLTHLSQEDVTARVDICRNLQKILSRTEFTECVAYPFGSSISSLGFPGCDLDIFLDLGDHRAITMTEQQKVKAAMKVLRGVPQCDRLKPILAADVCRFNKNGFCKFGEECRNRHVREICGVPQCGEQECERRHPRPCRFFAIYGSCRFGEDCAYLHKVKKDDAVVELEHRVAAAEERIRALEDLIRQIYLK